MRKPAILRGISCNSRAIPGGQAEAIAKAVGGRPLARSRGPNISYFCNTEIVPNLRFSLMQRRSGNEGRFSAHGPSWGASRSAGAARKQARAARTLLQSDDVGLYLAPDGKNGAGQLRHGAPRNRPGARRAAARRARALRPGAGRATHEGAEARGGRGRTGRDEGDFDLSAGRGGARPLS